MAESKDIQIDVSVIMTVHNAAEWIEDALRSILAQTFQGKLELSLFDDASTDASFEVLDQLRKKFEEKGIKIVTGSHANVEPKGVGYGCNCAIRQSSGKYICILDADDVMVPDRIMQQYAACQEHSDAIVGCQFSRIPAGSTERYTRWCNTLTESQLYTQAFTAFGPTMIKPTWFFSRGVYHRVGPFSEGGKGTPEDLLFFYKHLSIGGKLVRVDLPLLVYRYHSHCTTHSVSRYQTQFPPSLILDSQEYFVHVNTIKEFRIISAEIFPHHSFHRQTIWCLRVKAVQDFLLSKWQKFTIWNAGKQGRRLFRSLTRENQAKVVAFCDVDAKKIALGHYTYEQSKLIPKPRVPILHYTTAKPPFLLCVKWDMTEGVFEKNLASLNLREGEDYYHFS